MRNVTRITAIAGVMTAVCLSPANSFVLPHNFGHSINPFPTTGTAGCWTSHHKRMDIPLFMVARYGPDSGSSSTSKEDDEQAEWERLDDLRIQQQKVQFRNLVKTVLETNEPAHLPRVMTQHMDLITTMRGQEGADLIAEILQEETSDSKQEQLMEAIEFILNFAEEFVNQAQSLDDTNKRLLGNIIKCMTDHEEKASSSTYSRNEKQRDLESKLDKLMQDEKSNFTAGFLRHLEGECERIASAPKMTRQSSKLLETVRVIQTRVLEEVGQDLGEGALVLGQLLGYDTKKERMAVLQAGLMVRGTGFAKELLDLTQEALEGFEKVPNGADPDLVEIVQDVHDHIQTFIDKHDVLQ